MSNRRVRGHQASSRLVIIIEPHTVNHHAEHDDEQWILHHIDQTCRKRPDIPDETTYRPFNGIINLLLDAANLAPETSTTPATRDLGQPRKALLERQVSARKLRRAHRTVAMNLLCYTCRTYHKRTRHRDPLGLLYPWGAAGNAARWTETKTAHLAQAAALNTGSPRWAERPYDYILSNYVEDTR